MAKLLSIHWALVTYILCASLRTCSSFALDVESPNVEGRVRIDGPKHKSVGVKIVLNGGERITYTRQDGSFAFHNVPPGVHLLEAVTLGYYFAPLRVAVNARSGQVRASYAEDQRRVLRESMVLEPEAPEEYFEKKEPFSLMGFVKSPFGLMLCFMTFVLIVLPQLKIDPEEMEKMQEELRNQKSPSITSLLMGGHGGGQQ
eukprot:TRINITY_DN22253_c0_g1_i1.p1 TRINITY_DN22253_c0_g1~~TRINITY_DN22253_c0_g1_i1.p1  ORF type:complete len:217 (-),score=47.37 TRINITY_DN22253_c0_g1_i1:399-1001(-)